MKALLDFENKLKIFVDEMELVQEEQSEIMFNVNIKKYYQEGTYTFKDFYGNIMWVVIHEISLKNTIGTTYIPKKVKFNGFNIKDHEDFPFVIERVIELIKEGI